jgi:hypothetical protein
MMSTSSLTGVTSTALTDLSATNVDLLAKHYWLFTRV